MEQKRPVIDQPSRCSLLILPFESRRSIEFSPAFERERATGRPDKRGPEKKREKREARARRMERKKNRNRETSSKKLSGKKARGEQRLDEQISSFVSKKWERIFEI